VIVSTIIVTTEALLLLTEKDYPENGENNEFDENAREDRSCSSTMEEEVSISRDSIRQ
jgi:hypothetical protein